MFSYIFFPLLFIPTVLFRNLFVKDAIPCRYYRVVRSSGMCEVVVLHDMNIVTLFQNYTTRFIKCMAKYTTMHPPNEPIFMYDDITNVLMCTLGTNNVEALVEELEKDHAMMCVHDEYMDYVDELEDSRSNISEESGPVDEATYYDDDEYEKVQQEGDDAVIVQATDSHIGDENDDIEEIEASENENHDKKDQ